LQKIALLWKKQLDRVPIFPWYLDALKGTYIAAAVLKLYQRDKLLKSLLKDIKKSQNTEFIRTQKEREWESE
jgi:hypothetical protein